MLRMMYHLPGEALDRITGQFNPEVPPRRLRFVGPGDFQAIGKHMMALFIRYGDLKPTEHVLDMGCGVGRMAMPLSQYLNAEGSYVGFDIVPEAIAWCRKNISDRYAHFTFHHVDIYNQSYNPSGTLQASEYVFDLPNDHFDFVFATSLFTHLKPPDAAQYVAEMARVMRPGGRCFCTFFLLQAHSINVIEAGESYLPFNYVGERCRFVDPQIPEQAIAFDETYIRDLFAQHHLQIHQPIRYGSWAKRTSTRSNQDIIIATKPD